MSEPVTVVVVTWNSRALLPELLASLPDACAGLDWQLVVADNDSSDGTPDVLRAQAPSARLIEMGRNAGYSAGINAAIAATGTATPVLVLNPDIRLDPGAVVRLLDAAAAPGVGITVPRLVDETGSTIHSLRREPTVGRALGEALLGGDRAGRIPALGEVITDPDAYRVAATVDWATGAAMLLTPGCLDAVGPWDESFFLYSEETDFALRARDAGFHVRYVPDARATHLGGESHVNSELWTILTLNRIRLYGQRHGRASTAAFSGAVTLNEAIRAAAGRKPSRAALAALLRPSRRPPQLGSASHQLAP
jgi:N-acetylglucosaminyl-diphospho-decaprenol L-rhamnosyltransferase